MYSIFGGRNTTIAAHSFVFRIWLVSSHRIGMYLGEIWFRSVACSLSKLLSKLTLLALQMERHKETNREPWRQRINPPTGQYGGGGSMRGSTRL
jgi:hypothetical protein